MNDGEENPIASGLVALVAVAVVVGLLAGIAVLAGTRLLGLGGDGGGSSTGDDGGGGSLVMPDPVPTERESDPLITLAPTETETTEAASASPSPSKTPVDKETEAEAELVLTASPSSVANGEEVMLSGTYLRGGASVLEIWYKVDDGAWEEFTLDVNVSGGIFQIYVQTWRTGDIQWQVRDESANIKSDPVTVHHGA